MSEVELDKNNFLVEAINVILSGIGKNVPKHTSALQGNAYFLELMQNNSAARFLDAKVHLSIVFEVPY
jgi:hypothetical protein